MKSTPFFLLLCLTATVAYAQLPVTINTSYVSNNRYEINLVKETPIDPETAEPYHEFEFETKSKATGRLNHIIVGERSGNLVKEITNLHLFDEHIFIVEAKRRRAHTISVFDLSNSRREDFIWCYKPTPSPSKRFWVFDKFRSYGPPGTDTGVVLVYDMQKSPTQNRLPRTSTQTIARVGIPIYPESYVTAKAYVADAQLNLTPGWQHSIASPFLWSHDEQQVLFLCIHRSERYDRSHIVRVDLSAGVDNPRIFERPIIMTSDFLKTATPGQPPRELDASLRKNRYLSAETIEWLGSTQVVIKTHSASYHLKEEIILPVP